MASVTIVEIASFESVIERESGSVHSENRFDTHHSREQSLGAEHVEMYPWVKIRCRFDSCCKCTCKTFCLHRLEHPSAETHAGLQCYPNRAN
jgi:hypothetical protein